MMPLDNSVNKDILLNKIRLAKMHVTSFLV